MSLSPILFRFFPITKYQVSGNSMLPTYQPGDTLLVNKLAYWLANPRENDIVVLRDPRTNREILKRVIAVKDNHFVVEGDNKQASTDSRQFGPVEKKALVGKVIYQL